MHTFRTVMALGTMLAVVLTVPVTRAQDGMEPLGGQPPAGATASVKDFDYQIKYQSRPTSDIEHTVFDLRPLRIPGIRCSDRPFRSRGIGAVRP
jgi:hypothetical protein